MGISLNLKSTVNLDSVVVYILEHEEQDFIEQVQEGNLQCVDGGDVDAWSDQVELMNAKIEQVKTFSRAGFTAEEREAAKGDAENAVYALARVTQGHVYANAIRATYEIQAGVTNTL